MNKIYVCLDNNKKLVAYLVKEISEKQYTKA